MPSPRPCPITDAAAKQPFHPPTASWRLIRGGGLASSRAAALPGRCWTLVPLHWQARSRTTRPAAPRGEAGPEGPWARLFLELQDVQRSSPGLPLASAQLPIATHGTLASTLHTATCSHYLVCHTCEYHRILCGPGRIPAPTARKTVGHDHGAMGRPPTEKSTHTVNLEPRPLEQEPPHAPS